MNYLCNVIRNRAFIFLVYIWFLAINIPTNLWHHCDHNNTLILKNQDKFIHFSESHDCAVCDYQTNPVDIAFTFDINSVFANITTGISLDETIATPTCNSEFNDRAPPVS